MQERCIREVMKEHEEAKRERARRPLHSDTERQLLAARQHSPLALTHMAAGWVYSAPNQIPNGIISSSFRDWCRDSFFLPPSPWHSCEIRMLGCLRRILRGFLSEILKRSIFRALGCVQWSFAVVTAGFFEIRISFVSRFSAIILVGSLWGSRKLFEICMCGTFF